MKAKRLLGNLAVISIILIMLSYVSVEIRLLPKPYVYPICGILGGLVIAFCVLSSDLWAAFDTVLLCAFFCAALISSTLAGISPLEFFMSRFFAFWMIGLSMYYTVQVVSDGKRAICLFFFFSTLIISLISVYTLLHASAYILAGVFNEDVRLGSFSGGRFYAIGNANAIGLASAGNILMSVASLLEYGKRNRALRIYYGITAFIGWMILGLSGCRTGRVAVTIAIALFSFVMLFHKFENKKKMLLPAMVLSALVFTVTLLSFSLPDLIYKGVMSLIGLVFNIDVWKELSSISLHKISEDDGTMSGRTQLWVSGVKACFKNARRFFFGISPLSVEQLGGVYAGHHEIKAVHSHNGYIELFRKHGLIGFIPMMSLIVAWFVNSLNISFFEEKDSFNIFVAFSFWATMLTGMVEAMPFISSTESHITLLFFITCGYCMMIGRKQQ